MKDTKKYLTFKNSFFMEFGRLIFSYRSIISLAFIVLYAGGMIIAYRHLPQKLFDLLKSFGEDLTIPYNFFVELWFNLVVPRLGILMSIIFAIDFVVLERNTHQLDFWLSKPIRRQEYVFSKFLAVCGTFATVFMGSSICIYVIAQVFLVSLPLADFIILTLLSCFLLLFGIAVAASVSLISDNIVLSGLISLMTMLILMVPVQAYKYIAEAKKLVYISPFYFLDKLTTMSIRGASIITPGLLYILISFLIIFIPITISSYVFSKKDL